MIDGQNHLCVEQIETIFRTSTRISFRRSFLQIFLDSNMIQMVGCKIDYISKVSSVPVWGPGFEIDNLYSVKPFAENLLKWILECESMCTAVLGNPEQGAVMFNEVFVSTKPKKDQPRLVIEVTSPSKPYCLLKTVMQ